MGTGNNWNNYYVTGRFDRYDYSGIIDFSAYQKKTVYYMTKRKSFIVHQIIKGSYIKIKCLLTFDRRILYFKRFFLYKYICASLR